MYFENKNACMHDDDVEYATRNVRLCHGDGSRDEVLCNDVLCHIILYRVMTHHVMTYCAM